MGPPPLPRGVDTILKLDENGLYILLSEQTIQYHWHWALYLHRQSTEGLAFHITRETAADPWAYEGRSVKNVIFSIKITAALKIAIVPPDMHDAFSNRVAQMALEETERFKPLTCRTWLLQAVYELDNEGYIAVKPGTRVEDIEAEAKEIGEANATAVQTGVKIGSREKVRKSAYSVA